MFSRVFRRVMSIPSRFAVPPLLVKLKWVESEAEKNRKMLAVRISFA